MKPKGIENVEAIITSCENTVAALDSSSETAWKDILNSVLSALEELKPKFFLKTNLAVPITNVCLKDAKELESLAEKKELEPVPAVLERFRSNITKLLKNAQMDGLTIT